MNMHVTFFVGFIYEYNNRQICMQIMWCWWKRRAGEKVAERRKIVSLSLLEADSSALCVEFCLSVYLIYLFCLKTAKNPEDSGHVFEKEFAVHIQTPGTAHNLLHCSQFTPLPLHQCALSRKFWSGEKIGPAETKLAPKVVRAVQNCMVRAHNKIREIFIYLILGENGFNWIRRCRKWKTSRA